MIVHKSTTGLYRSIWNLEVQWCGAGRRPIMYLGSERTIAGQKKEVGKLRGGGRVS